ncbi:MAG: DUF2490 domain-containing protein [Cyclobacteriaceae bacterium]|nr:DUF2490 domain-containing protein [Cyclobacteriaceae bacterium]
MTSNCLKNGILTITIFYFTVNPINAQEITPYNNQQWFQYYNHIKLTDKSVLKSDVGYRRKNNIKNLSQYIVRTGIDYKITPHVQLVVGFAHFWHYGNNDSLNRLESRPFQEVIINDDHNTFKISHRFRAEQRIFTTNTSGYFNHRFRYRVLVNIPIVGFTKKGKDSKLYLNLSDEIFIHTGDETDNNLFAKNRVMIGTTFRISNELHLIFNYVYDYSLDNLSEILLFGIKQTF